MMDIFNISNTQSNAQAATNKLVYQSIFTSSLTFLGVLGLALSFPAILPMSFYAGIAQHPFIVLFGMIGLSGLSFYGKISLLNPKSSIMNSVAIFCVYWTSMAAIFSLPLMMHNTANVAIAATGAIGSLVLFSLYGIVMNLATQKKISSIIMPLVIVNIVLSLGLSFFYQNFSYVMLAMLSGLVLNCIALSYTTSIVKTVMEDANNRLFFNDKTKITRLMLFLNFTIVENVFSIFLQLLRILELFNNDKKRN
jgi:hypothetical protein